MKRLVILLFSLCLLILSSAVNTVNAQQTFKTTSETVIGLLQYLPKDYASNSNKYPLVIFLHGIGERGANSTNPATLESTIYSVDNLGPPYYAKNGTDFPFILISPQLKNNYSSWPNWYVLEVINWAKNTLRVDEKRIHITGLSMGGAGAWTMAQDYPKLFASSGPVCGAYNSTSKACAIASENLPIWAFHGDADTTVPLSRTTNMVNAINACSPAPNPRAKVTIYPGVRHDAWNRAYKPDHTYHNPNLYDWMMGYYNNRNGSNYIPTANAGSDKTYSSTSTINLSGSGSDSDGSISSYRWAKISGPSATLSNSGAANPSASVSSSGTYVFRLTVTDNAGATDSDYIKVTVGSTSSSNTTTNAAPNANAGSDVGLTLPASTAYLNGSASDSDGSIASWSWAKISGPSCSLSGATTSRLTAYKLVAGSYVFRLTVRDNDGATDYDDVKVTVNGTGNSAPVVNAGADFKLYLPASTAYMPATASDSDGSIVSWNWVKLTGPACSLSGATTSKLTAYKMVAGSYVFRVTVKDNNGATDYDDIKIIVYP
jgi:predicted esterase